MKKHLRVPAFLFLLICLLPGYINQLKAQDEDRLTNFLVASKYKNWEGVASQKADNPTITVKFKFYRNGNAEQQLLKAGAWKKTTGKWSLSQEGDTWILNIIGKAYRVVPHFAQTDAKESLELLDQDDFNAGRLVKTFELRAKGFN